jgi:hypothetical protein
MVGRWRDLCGDAERKLGLCGAGDFGGEHIDCRAVLKKAGLISGSGRESLLVMLVAGPRST